VVALLGFYILGNLMIPGKIPRDCQSTTKCCYACLILFLYDDDDVISAFMPMMLLFQPRAVDDVVAPTLCCDDVVVPASCC
jgi:hypothetical protein